MHGGIIILCESLHFILSHCLLAPRIWVLSRDSKDFILNALPRKSSFYFSYNYSLENKSQHRTANFLLVCVFCSSDWILGFLYAIWANNYLAMLSGPLPLLFLRHSLLSCLGCLWTHAIVQGTLDASSTSGVDSWAFRLSSPGPIGWLSFYNLFPYIYSMQKLGVPDLQCWI